MSHLSFTHIIIIYFLKDNILYGETVKTPRCETNHHYYINKFILTNINLSNIFLLDYTIRYYTVGKDKIYLGTPAYPYHFSFATKFDFSMFYYLYYNFYKYYRQWKQEGRLGTTIL